MDAGLDSLGVRGPHLPVTHSSAPPACWIHDSINADAAVSYVNIGSSMTCCLTCAKSLLLDDAGAVELRNALIAAFAVDLPPTIAIDHPTTAALSAFISSRASATTSATSAAGSTSGAAPDITAVTLREGSVRDAVQAAVADIMGGGAMVIEAGQPLMEAGLDSLGAVELRNALQSRFGVQLPATIVVDHPSINALSAFLCTIMASAAPAVFASIGALRRHLCSDVDAPYTGQAQAPSIPSTKLSTLPAPRTCLTTCRCLGAYGATEL